MAPNGLIVQLDGPYAGKQHSSNVLNQGGLLNCVRSLNERLDIPLSERLSTYADKAYQTSLFVVPVFKDAVPGSLEAKLNDQMKFVLIGLEWGFGKVGQLFRFTVCRELQNISNYSW